MQDCPEGRKGSIRRSLLVCVGLSTMQRVQRNVPCISENDCILWEEVAIVDIILHQMMGDH